MREHLWHNLSADGTLLEIESSANGLTLREVEQRKKENGLNHLPQKKSDGLIKIFARQFMSPLIIVLFVAGILSAVIDEWVDAGVIIAAVFFNTIVGFVQEYKANKSLKHLRSLVLPRSLVRRDNREIEIDSRDIVVGDILILRTGDRVSADARVFESVELFTNESALTGESLPVSKTRDTFPENTQPADRGNMVFAGTSIVGGRGLAVVVATSGGTELGKIASLVESTKDEKTPLQTQLLNFARAIAVLILVLVVILFGAGLATGRPAIEMFSMAVALAVAAIPEGLAVSVTIILAIGMQRILRRKSLVRTLVGAETLGSVSIICTDKTGTITKGEMNVTHIATANHVFDLASVATNRARGIDEILRAMSLCNDAMIDGDTTRGNHTEQALLLGLREIGFDRETFAREYSRTAEIPFDSSRKYMVTAHASGQGSVVYLKGALSSISSFLGRVNVDGETTELTQELRELIEDQESSLTSKGLRLIAVAQKNTQSPIAHIKQDDLSDFIFYGFVCLSDPLRAEVRSQIQDASLAGVRTIMVTGDHPQTALAIGKEAGLIVNQNGVITGRELDEWSDEDLSDRISGISIFARVEPRHKIRIVRAWQSRGEVVAMTGDGVNDAPALKAADIGIALGSGTEVAKQASDLVVLDNNLGIITSAIEEGRVIFDNIRKTAAYLLADSFTEIVLIGGSILLGLPIPLLPVQILWINLVADCFPNIGLTLEPGESDVMRLPPRPRNEPVLNREMITLVFIIGIVTDLLLFALYVWLLNRGEDIQTIRSIMFAAVGIDSLLYIFAVKSFRRTIFRINPFSNLWLVCGVAIGFGLMAIAMFTPFLQQIFEIVPLALSDWVLLLIIGLIKLIAIEFGKEIFILS
jgi:Ca2+-transporting ATPase